MSAARQSLEQSQAAPEKKLDSSEAPGNKLPGVDRIALMQDYSPRPTRVEPSLPGLSLVSSDSIGSIGDKQKPQTDATVTKEQRIDSARQALESPQSTIKQKMEAMSSLYNDMDKTRGSVHVKLNDGGKEKEFEISKQSVGKNVHLLQMRTTDENGHSHPVLRGVERNGEFEQQKHRNGSKADYRGDWWTANAKDSSITQFAQKNDSDKQPEAKVEPKLDPKLDPKIEPSRAPQLAPEAGPQVERSNKGDSQPRLVKPDAQVNPDADQQEQQSPLPPHRPVQPENKDNQGEPKKNHDGVVIPWRKRAGSDDKQEPSGDGKTVNTSDLSTFYSRQKDGHSCAGIASGMMYAKERMGRPLSDNENYKFKQVTHTTEQGYRGSLETLSSQLASTGLKTRAYDYGMGNVGQQAMHDLNRELDQGHSAVAKVINPHTGNPHYIFIAGRNNDGNYIIGDPDRKNTQHFKPVSQQYLQSIMHRRDGFVAGY